LPLITVNIKCYLEESVEEVLHNAEIDFSILLYSKVGLFHSFSGWGGKWPTASNSKHKTERFFQFLSADCI